MKTESEPKELCLCIVSREYADYLGSCASVAGGWMRSLNNLDATMKEMRQNASILNMLECRGFRLPPSVQPVLAALPKHLVPSADEICGGREALVASFGEETTAKTWEILHN